MVFIRWLKDETQEIFDSLKTDIVKLEMINKTLAELNQIMIEKVEALEELYEEE